MDLKLIFLQLIASDFCFIFLRAGSQTFETRLDFMVRDCDPETEELAEDSYEDTYAVCVSVLFLKEFITVISTCIQTCFWNLIDFFFSFVCYQLEEVDLTLGDFMVAASKPNFSTVWSSMQARTVNFHCSYSLNLFGTTSYYFKDIHLFLFLFFFYVCDKSHLFSLESNYLLSTIDCVRIIVKNIYYFYCGKYFTPNKQRK